jgi:hypothetical protein
MDKEMVEGWNLIVRHCPRDPLSSDHKMKMNKFTMSLL